MPNFSEQHKIIGLPLYASQCSGAEEQYGAFINPEECEKLKESCNSVGINGITCRHPKVVQHIEDVYGLDLRTVIARPQSKLILPPAFPVVKRGLLQSSSNLVQHEVLGVSLEEILTSRPYRSNGRLRLSPKFDINTDFLKQPIFQGKQAVLFLTNPDVVIENFWHYALVKDFFEKIASMGFVAVVSINFSLFIGECPVCHALNMKKALESFRYLQEAGVTAIPHIYFINKYQVYRWADWLNVNPSVDTIALNCQMQSAGDFEFINEGLLLLAANVKRKLNLILEGPPLGRLPDLCAVNQFNLIIASKRPAVEALAWQKLSIKNGRIVKIGTGANPKITLFNDNANLYLQALRGAAAANCSVAGGFN